MNLDAHTTAEENPKVETLNTYLSELVSLRSDDHHYSSELEQRLDQEIANAWDGTNEGGDALLAVLDQHIDHAYKREDAVMASQLMNARANLAHRLLPVMVRRVSLQQLSNSGQRVTDLASEIYGCIVHRSFGQEGQAFENAFREMNRILDDLSSFPPHIVSGSIIQPAFQKVYSRILGAAVNQGKGRAMEKGQTDRGMIDARIHSLGTLHNRAMNKLLEAARESQKPSLEAQILRLRFTRQEVRETLNGEFMGRAAA